MQLRDHFLQYAYLMRLDKPIGILLLLWPTLWALWIATAGEPPSQILFIFIAGVVLMRSAGCVINDCADREFDPDVLRTRSRPLASGKIAPKHALILAATLAAVAFLLVLFCNRLTIVLSFVGAALACIYPYLKRMTHLPQFGLSLAFTWGVPMAFAATTGTVSKAAWFLFLTAGIWPIIYDTMYAMVDRSDDIQVGIKSTAVLFDSMDKMIIGLLQTLFIVMLIIVGLTYRLHSPFYLSLLGVAGLFAWQQWLIRHRDPLGCLNAFRNNNWVGLVIFIGIYLSYQT
jgi:4-hydroxybenzoate polyprenyltransferase